MPNTSNNQKGFVEARQIEQSKVVAVVCSDLHLSHLPPIARSVEPDWYIAMARPLRELKRLAEKYNAPVICAGDVFDDGWRANKCPPELINFALDNLPDMYAICGQHDTFHHRLEDIKRSAFWTLVKSEKLTYLEPGKPVEVMGRCPIRLYGFPWGIPITPLKQPHDMFIEVAVVHAYIWRKGKGFIGAPEEQRLSKYLPKLVGYDVAVVGDNHISWESAPKTDKFGSFVFNVGGFQRRRVDEKDHRPRLGLLHDDGTITSYYLKTDKDRFVEDEESPKGTSLLDGAEDFLDELRGLTDAAISFQDAVRKWMDKENVSDGVRKAILSTLDCKKV